MIDKLYLSYTDVKQAREAVMDIALRILHIVLGIFWAGTYIFATFILLPQLKKLGRAIEQPAMKAILRVTSPVMMVVSLAVLGTGIAMVVRARLPVSTYFSTGWGLAMFIAFIAVVIAIIIGFSVLAPTGSRMEKLGRRIEGREPTEDENIELEQLSRRITTFDRVNFSLVIIATLAMPISRFL
jgi:putative copper export protein